MRIGWAALLFALVLSPPLAWASDGELALPPREAFAIGARTRVLDVATMDHRPFNQELKHARSRGERWTESFIQIALRFAQPPAQGSEQSVLVEAMPQGWEGIETLTWVRVTIEDRAYADDSISGERWMIWLVVSPGADGLEVFRGLRAGECRRATPESWFYSARPCL